MNIGNESETIEFKKSTSELRSALNSISAILNKHGKGIIYFGVKNNGDVCGQEIGNNTLRDVSKAIRDNIRPECNFEVNLKKCENNVSIIEVTFNGDRCPYSNDGKYYIRFSDEDRAMTNDELEKYFKTRIKDYSYWELSDSNVPLEEVDEKLLKNVINEGHENKRVPFEFDDTKSILNKFGLLSKNKETLNNAGNVLFSKNKPILLKLATYATESKETFLKLDHFNGNIYECINKSLEYIVENINWNITIDGTTSKRIEEPEIPRSALREIIVNAFSHGSYDSNTSFEISVFKNRVTIYSPGFFPSGLTPEDFANNGEEPIMLNPKIVNVLFKTCEIESFGSGFNRTFKICKEKNVNYDYENTKNGFRFTFYRLNTPNVGNGINETTKVVYNIIKDNNYFTISEIALKINKSEKTVFRALKSLKELGIIKREGTDNKGHWEIID